MARTVGIIAAALFSSGCATDLSRHGEPVQIERRTTQTPRFHLIERIHLRLTKGRLKKPLEEGSEWKSVGVIPQGTVYRPVGDVMQAYTGHSYEAWLVVSENRAVGIFLPVEDVFIGAQPPRDVHWEPKP